MEIETNKSGPAETLDAGPFYHGAKADQQIDDLLTARITVPEWVRQTPEERAA